MIYIKKVPPANKILSEELIANGWIKIKEPKNLLTTILASIPFMITNGILAIFICILFYNPLVNFNINHSINISINILDILYIIISSFVMIILHELIHMMWIPNFIKSDKVFWGITINGGFVSTTEKISKIRFIIISIMPLIILSFVFPIILGVCNILNGLIMFLIIVNAMASSVDILNIFLILFQAPKNSLILNNGFETYFNKP